MIRDGDGPRRLVVVAVERWAGRVARRRRAGHAGGPRDPRRKRRDRAADVGDHVYDAAEALVEGARLGGYHFGRYFTDATATPPPMTLAVWAETDDPDGLDEALVTADTRAEATNVARDLVNISPDEKVPDLLAERMAELAEAVGLTVDIWGMDRIRDAGMGGLLGVNRGSQDEARFAVFEHAPEGTETEAPVVLVGKGVTFDTGGLSLKPTKDSMDKMKADMGGAAAVFGAIYGAAELGVQVRTIALIPMTDNRPGEKRGRAGRRAADALGRDRRGDEHRRRGPPHPGRRALARADARSAPRRRRGDADGRAGRRAGRPRRRLRRARMGDDALADRIRAASDASGEMVWPLPLYPHYKEQLKSPVADLSNVGGAMAGTITAAAFLEHFTRAAGGEIAYPWAHFDIARPSFLDAAHGVHPAGGTGFGVRLLIRLSARGMEAQTLRATDARLGGVLRCIPRLDPSTPSHAPAHARRPERDRSRGRAQGGAPRAAEARLVAVGSASVLRRAGAGARARSGRGGRVGRRDGARRHARRARPCAGARVGYAWGETSAAGGQQALEAIETRDGALPGRRRGRARDGADLERGDPRWPARRFQATPRCSSRCAAPRRS